MLVTENFNWSWVPCTHPHVSVATALTADVTGLKTNSWRKKKSWWLVAAGFHHVKLSPNVCVMFHWPAHAAQQQTRRLTESRWGPSGELNVSCCAKLQKNNSSSRCPQRKTEGSGKPRQPCQRGSQCLIIMLSARDGRITTCPFIVYMLGFSRHGRLAHWLWFCFKVEVNLFGFAVASLISQQSTLAPPQRQSGEHLFSDWLAGVS